MKIAPFLLLVGIASVTACAKQGVQSASSTPSNWKSIVTPADMNRIRNWRTAFVKALEFARAKGNGPGIAAEGALLDPDAALAAPALAPGRYSCRVIKLGGGAPHMAALVTYPATPCQLTAQGVLVSFAKTGGVQRPVGLIFPGEGPRQIFLGTMVLGDEARAMEYGRDATRDMAGAVERIGPRRWRLILPYPHMESTMDVIELVPSA
jgi:Domain of unknown function (DUF4893)